MAHKYFVTRGRDIFVRRFIEDLSEKMVPMKMKRRNGTDVNVNIQIVPRPIQLWELAYPEEHESVVKSLLGVDANSTKFLDKAKRFFSGLFGLKQAEYKSNITETIPAIPRPFVAVHILGDREDKKDAFGNEML